MSHNTSEIQWHPTRTIPREVEGEPLLVVIPDMIRKDGGKGGVRMVRYQARGVFVTDLNAYYDEQISAWAYMPTPPEYEEVVRVPGMFWQDRE